MKLDQAKAAFIDQWGAMSSSWGIPRSMAQVHAVLLVSHEALNTDDIMSATKFSRGNVSMSVKDLVEWGLIYKVFKSGDRRDYYEAEKDMWIVMRRIIAERKRKELSPVIRQIERLSDVSDKDANPHELLAFKSVLKDIHDMGKSTDNFLNLFIDAKKAKIIKWVSKLG